MDADRTAIVLTGGMPAPPAVMAHLPAADLVIAADSGLAQAADLGLTADFVVGDMDSVDPELLAAARRDGARIETHPADKDATDLELALARARDEGAGRVIVVGGSGGRLDHLLGNALVLSSPEFADTAVEWWTDGVRVVVVRSAAVLHGAPEDLVSLLAVGGPAGGVRTTGLRWPLDGEDLAWGSTRGMSNEMTAATAEVSIASGVLLAVHRYRP